MEKPNIVKHPQNTPEMSQRINSVDAWVDETLRDIQNRLYKMSEIKDEIEKQWQIVSLFDYVSGLIDGNRFNKKYPYSNENSPVNFN